MNAPAPAFVAGPALADVDPELRDAIVSLANAVELQRELLELVVKIAQPVTIDGKEQFAITSTGHAILLAALGNVGGAR